MEEKDKGYPKYKQIVSNYRRTIVVGDPHGCYSEFKQLLAKVGFKDDGQDLLISVGDNVDRGPYSADMLRFFRRTNHAFSVLGNHERKLARVIRGELEGAWSQKHTLTKIEAPDRADLVKQIDHLPLVIETPHAVIVHAQLDPLLPIRDQQERVACGVGGEDAAPPLDEAGIPLWFHACRYESIKNKPICIGHAAYVQVELVKRRLYALDTKAAKGHALTAVILPEGEIVTIPSQENYYQRAIEQWCQHEYLRPPPKKLEISKYLFLKELQDANSIQKQAITNFEAQLGNFAVLIQSAKHRLTEQFGAIPSPGPTRGDYIQCLRRSYPKESQRLLGFILSDKNNLDELLKQYRSFCLEDLYKLIEELL